MKLIAPQWNVRWVPSVAFSHAKKHACYWPVLLCLCRSYSDCRLPQITKKVFLNQCTEWITHYLYTPLWFDRQQCDWPQQRDVGLRFANLCVQVTCLVNILCKHKWLKVVFIRKKAQVMFYFRNLLVCNPLSLKISYSTDEHLLPDLSLSHVHGLCLHFLPDLMMCFTLVCTCHQSQRCSHQWSSTMKYIVLWVKYDIHFWLWVTEGNRINMQQAHH